MKKMEDRLIKENEQLKARIAELERSVVNQNSSTSANNLNDHKILDSIEKFKTIYNQSPIAIEIYDSKGKLVDVNQKTLDMFGINDSKYVLGFDLWSDPNLSSEKIERLKNGENIVISCAFDFERVKLNKLYPTSRSGKMFTDMYANPILYKSKIIGFLVHIIEVTQQIKAKELLKESEEKYKALYENAPLSYQSLNEDGSFKDVNPTWLNTLGYNREEVIGKFCIDFLHPDWKPHFKKNFPAFKVRGYVSGVEFKIRHKKGHYLYISFEGCIGYYPDGSFKQTYCVFKDVTEQKKAEVALKESEQRFNLAMKASNEGLFDWDIENNEIYYSPMWKQLLGYEDYELPNDFSVWEKTTNPDDVEKSLKLQQQLISKEVERFVLEFKMKHKNGHWVDILSRAEAVYNDAGKAIRIVGTHTDISQRKLTEEALRQSEELFSLFMKFSPVYTFIKEVTPTQSCVLVASDNFIDMINRSASDMKGKTMEELFPAEFAKKITADDWSVIDKGKVLQFDEDLNKRSYTTIKFPIIRSDRNLLAGFSIDVTERKLAEEELEKHRENLEQLVKERTKELVDKNKELDKALKVFVGREMTIRNLQNKIRALGGKL